MKLDGLQVNNNGMGILPIAYDVLQADRVPGYCKINNKKRGCQSEIYPGGKCGLEWLKIEHSEHSASECSRDRVGLELITRLCFLKAVVLSNSYSIERYSAEVRDTSKSTGS
jgi:hypothetical protein